MRSVSDVYEAHKKGYHKDKLDFVLYGLIKDDIVVMDALRILSMLDPHIRVSDFILAHDAVITMITEEGNEK